MAMRKKTVAEKAMRKMVEAAFYKAANGVVIPLMSIPKVYAAGEQAYKACENYYRELTAEEYKAAIEIAVSNAVTSVAVAS